MNSLEEWKSEVMELAQPLRDDAPRSYRKHRYASWSLSTKFNPWAHARRSGIDVQQGPLRTASGFWLPTHRAIILKEGMLAPTKRSILAHELGHASLAHDKNCSEHEDAADRWAASALIDPQMLLRAVSSADSPGHWCWTLGVGTFIISLALRDELKRRRAVDEALLGDGRLR